MCLAATCRVAAKACWTLTGVPGQHADDQAQQPAPQKGPDRVSRLVPRVTCVHRTRPHNFCRSRRPLGAGHNANAPREVH
ncbi:hypothetical protein ABBQ38_012161 [Trebouxia sp. C0009 RCD-2024]